MPWVLSASAAAMPATPPPTIAIRQLTATRPSRLPRLFVLSELEQTSVEWAPSLPTGGDRVDSSCRHPCRAPLGARAGPRYPCGVDKNDSCWDTWVPDRVASRPVRDDN